MPGRVRSNKSEVLKFLFSVSGASLVGDSDVESGVSLVGDSDVEVVPAQAIFVIRRVIRNTNLICTFLSY